MQERLEIISKENKNNIAERAKKGEHDMKKKIGTMMLYVHDKKNQCISANSRWLWKCIKELYLVSQLVVKMLRSYIVKCFSGNFITPKSLPPSHSPSKAVYPSPFPILHPMIKGIVQQFWIYNIYITEDHLIKQHRLEIIEKMVLKVSPCYVYDIYNSTRSDWLWLPSFLNYFESELFYRDAPFTKNVSFVWARKKCYIFKIGEQSLVTLYEYL